MIRKYRFGKPLNTEAVIKEYPVEKGEIPCIKVKEGEKISFLMTKGAPVYGLGEQVRGINKRGITVRELADICHFSEYHFMRFFKRHMNMTSIEYLNQYRLEIASRQLAETNLSVTSIALESGFNNISYFNRVFKRKFGVTPMEYRSSKPHSEITYAQHQMINTGKEQVASDDISHREKREDRIEDHKEAHHQSKDINDQ